MKTKHYVIILTLRCSDNSEARIYLTKGGVSTTYSKYAGEYETPQAALRVASIYTNSNPQLNIVRLTIADYTD